MAAATLLQRKRELVERTDRLTPQECVQLFRIFQRHDTRYTENKNGVFLNLASVPAGLVDEAFRFIDLCVEDRERNEQRDAQLREYEIEFERAAPAPAGVPAQEQDMLTIIKNDKALNTLERSIMRQNLEDFLVTSEPAGAARKSAPPKFSGMKARLLRSCRTISRSQAAMGELQPAETKQLARRPAPKCEDDGPWAAEPDADELDDELEDEPEPDVEDDVDE